MTGSQVMFTDLLDASFEIQDYAHLQQNISTLTSFLPKCECSNDSDSVLILGELKAS